MGNVDILLATFNSGRFLREQIMSIINQDFRDWRLIVRDAASSDDTVNIVMDFADKDNRIKYIGSGRADVARNFSELMSHSTAEYVMFADHDDVWLPDKISTSLAAMSRLEKRSGSETPLLVYTDAVVVDEGLIELSDSLFERIDVDPVRTLPRQLIVQNVAYGNTMLLNAALRDLAMPIPKQAFMHDAWIMLVASVYGMMEYCPKRTLLYRQHGENRIGGKKTDFGYYREKIKRGRAALRQRFYSNTRQAEAFALCYPDAPPCFKACVGFEKRNWIMRRWLLIRYGIFKNGFIRNLGVFFLI